MTERCRSTVSGRDENALGKQIYELSPGVRLLQSENGCFLLRSAPLSLLRINSAAFELLRSLDGRSALREAAAGLDPRDARRFLGQLERLGFVRARARQGFSTLPSISVVVPVRNRQRQIRECVDSLLSLYYPKDKLEIIVVDDASEDETPGILATLPIKAVLNPVHSGAAKCRNLGWQAARGELIAFTDSDCRADPGWLKELVDEMAEPDIAAVGGLVKSPGTGSRIDRYEACRSPLYSGGVEKEVKSESTISYLPTCNLIVRRSVLEHLGGFDVSFPLAVGEDVDLVWRMIDAGYRVLYVPRGGVTHHHRESVTQFAVRRAEYAASEAQLMRKHSARRRVVTLPGPSVIFFVLSAIGFIAGWPLAYATLALVVAIQALTMRRRLRDAFAFIGWKRVASAITRGHLGSVQYLLWTISQYYALPLLLVATATTSLGLANSIIAFGGVIASLALTAIFGYLIDRPRLDPASYVALFCLDKLAFQTGLIRGCLSYRTLRPLLPAVRIIW